MAEEDTPPGATSVLDMVMSMRNKEVWTRYDSILIGPGARDEDRGWFNDWSQFAGTNKIKLFAAPRPNTDVAWCNTSDREDWAQLVYMMNIEFIAPGGDLRRLSNAFDFDFASWWLTEVPRSTYCEVQLVSADQILSIPANFAPAGHGTTEARIDGSASPSIGPGTVGTANVGQGYVWTTPLGIPRGKRISVNLEFEQRIFHPLLGLTNAPGFTDFATVDPANPLNTIVRRIPNRFGIRVSLNGPRFAQLRGAYSQS